MRHEDVIEKLAYKFQRYLYMAEGPFDVAIDIHAKVPEALRTVKAPWIPGLLDILALLADAGLVGEPAVEVLRVARAEIHQRRWEHASEMRGVCALTSSSR